MSSKLPISAAARNAVWSYPKEVPPRFPNAPTIMETIRSHEPLDLFTLPEGSDVTVELYGGPSSLWLDGGLHRVYIRRFAAIRFLEMATEPGMRN